MVAETGAPFLPIKAELGTLADIPRIVEEAAALSGRADILVNNAGTIRRADSIDFTEEDWDAVMDLNLKSVFFLSQAFARHLLAEGHRATSPPPIPRPFGRTRSAAPRSWAVSRRDAGVSRRIWVGRQFSWPPTLRTMCMA